MNNFKELNFSDFKVNPFEKIGKEWMLITAKKGEQVNTMTASWGGLGVMWGKNVSFIGIRPQRYTKEFVDSSNTFSLCFFNSEYKEKLTYLGTVSGRDENKIKKSEFTIDIIDNTPIFKEANLVLICKKLYKQILDPNCFLDKTLTSTWYPKNDYHDLYVSEIQKILVK